ncbi:MAG: nucleoside triphosphate pyrophosphohydrolase [Candidatus Marinimicrobia bacterium]|nr:nucleoside triphosphate pyrophosphohydrolase [Candidatus Neomarinimicrobiota bacterium]MCF7830141.1 nucleoside triphosphate pyrophosphohydrolase [Candidatus Neomarinimicrobiota bacterium]MCF7882218.1 nucleoside triphosphate pyrophosphohydrolase [Candidatus Neomarinimicrobiota bacterium]
MPQNLPDLPEDKFRALVEILKILRSPDGCPWDRKQTHKSLVPHLLEEAHEVVEMIDHQDSKGLKGELGDLIMHVVFQSQIAEEDDEFSIDDVIESINQKLIRRHPHVFSDSDVEDEDEVIKNWEQIKMEEGRESVIDGVPKSLSALIRANRLQQKASQVGFDWDSAEPVWDKVDEEIAELREVVESGATEEIEEEFGDLLFSLVNLSRFLKVNPEDALRHTINKFIRRFQAIEKRVNDENLDMDGMTLEELDAHWDAVKSEESQRDN